MNRKSLITFLLITFGLAWTLFCIPLVFKSDSQSTTYLVVWQVCFMAAMWAPGLGAIFATRLVEKQPVIKTLRLNTLGPKRFYILAWFLPPLLLFATIGVSNLLGTGTVDPNFTFMRESMAKAAAGIAMPGVEILVLGQVAFALTLAPFINLLFAIGEELGWRGFLLPNLMPLGQRKAILVSGLIWGLWHAPAVAQGLNYPGYPVAGVFMMIVFCILLGTIFSWLYLNTKSPWVAALAHGSINASAGLSVLFFQPGFNMALGGTIATPVAWLGMALFIGWLVLSKRLPVQVSSDTQVG